MKESVQKITHHLLHFPKDFVLQLNSLLLSFNRRCFERNETTSSHINELFEMKQIQPLSWIWIMSVNQSLGNTLHSFFFKFSALHEKAQNLKKQTKEIDFSRVTFSCPISRNLPVTCDQAQLYHHRSYPVLCLLMSALATIIFRFALPAGKVYQRNENRAWSQVGNLFLRT